MTLQNLDQPGPHQLGGRPGRDIRTIKSDGAAPLADQGRHRMHRGALAGPVTAENADELAGMDAERDAVQRFRLAVCDM